MTTLPFAARLARSLATLTRPLQRRPAISDLERLDERMLHDIGLSRVDVDAMRRMW